ncbi:hypothetical protein BDP55DRAFT_654526 [Colletotrichum godetiae]|uniref:Uncharacterized protein n=1 Tax=Colletotrichum godetiae TaxID=1209918 RepID=A0AAJ0AT77_9PEZI|nr:uncharacterized protein BDP55DRAFT_654526 [Colletotrichum godetiae]KAK1689192.1 hypothetical protein BDP55DRAFT_654526 [Colletotrichum godetiae]
MTSQLLSAFPQIAASVQLQVQVPLWPSAARASKLQAQTEPRTAQMQAPPSQVHGLKPLKCVQGRTVVPPLRRCFFILFYISMNTF